MGIIQSGTTHAGASSGPSIASFQDISLSKFIDKASPQLITHIANGKHIKEGTLFVTADTGLAQPVLVSKLKLEDIIVSSLSVSSSSNDQPAENTTLNFSKFTITNYTINNDPYSATKSHYSNMLLLLFPIYLMNFGSIWVELIKYLLHNG